MRKLGPEAIILFAVVASLLVAGLALGNGGPFVIKYPDGDPAAKGVLARLDPDLKPARETRLHVLKEDLSVVFARDKSFVAVSPPGGREGISEVGPPLAQVIAAYTIENPTDEEITVDFGFPILRGVYSNPYAMMRIPDANVQLNNLPIESFIISNSAIYGMIRQRARETIDKAIAADEELAGLVAAVREANDDETRMRARKTLAKYSQDKWGMLSRVRWTERETALLVEYASLELGAMKSAPRDVPSYFMIRAKGMGLRDLIQGNLGPLSAIGEQKATQFLAYLASTLHVGPRVDVDYESIFKAWGGDVRERSVDLKTGELRPREVTVDDAMLVNARRSGDPTLYARVDYLDENAKITGAERASCKTILKNLPVIFTFAPMNLIHYQVTFPAKTTEVLKVSYKQYAYADTKEPSSYQLAYVVHPASMWDHFGPIKLHVTLPGPMGFKASIPLERVMASSPEPAQVYAGTVEDKTGELFIAIDRADWETIDGAPRKATVRR